MKQKMTPREGGGGIADMKNRLPRLTQPLPYVLRVGASGLRKERAISDLNANKRNLVQIQFGIVYSGVHLRMCSRSQRIACLLDTC